MNIVEQDNAVPLITIGVPAYQCESHISATLDAILAQTERRLRLHVSLDVSSDGSEAVIRRYLDDTRVTLTVQPERLGWVGNFNFLTEQCDTPYYANVFHDDLVEPTYLERLLAALEGAPEAVCAFSDMERVDERGSVIRQTGRALHGSKFERMLEALVSPSTAAPLRGLTRSSAFQSGLRLKDYNTSGGGAEFMWSLQLAVLGEVVFVPEMLYRRTYLASGVSTNTWAADSEKFVWIFASVADHGLRLIEDQHFPQEQAQLLRAACLAWVHALAEQRFTAPGRSPDTEFAHLALDAAIIGARSAPDPIKSGLASISSATAVREMSAFRHLRSATSHLRSGNYYRAIAEAEIAAKLGSNSAEADGIRSSALHELGRFDEAAAAARESVANETADRAAKHARWRELGRSLYSARDFKGAEEAFREAVACNPECDYSYYFLSKSQFVLKNYTDSVQCARRAVELRPNSDDFAKWLSNVESRLPASSNTSPDTSLN